MATRRKVDETPSFGEWLATQLTDPDPVRRGAIEHVRGRWDVTKPWFDFAKVMRTLRREDSEHVLGMLLLADSYTAAFNLDPREQIKRVGSVSPLVPIDVSRCNHLTRSGTQCTRLGAPGNDLCWQHGGTWVSAEELERISKHTSERLMAATDKAIRVLEELLDEGKSEMVRLQAATAVLDRAGIGPMSRLELDISSQADHEAAEMRRRIEALAARTAQDAEDYANNNGS